MASGRNAVGWTDALTRLAPAQAPAVGLAHSSAAGGAAWHVMTLQCALCHLQSITTRGLVPTAMYISIYTLQLALYTHMSSCFFSFAVGTKPGKRHPQCQLQCRGPLLGVASGRGPPSVPPVGRGPRRARLCPVLGHCWREGEETIPRACFFLPPVVPLWPLGGVPLRPAVAGRLAANDK